MTAFRRILRRGFQLAEGGLERAFPRGWNPLYNLGALGFFFYWIVAVTGFYIYIFFDTSTSAAYQSVENLTREQWYVGGVMRSLHRYASDGLVLVMAIHLVREFAKDRYRGKRWFSWASGVPIVWFVIASGITGYWLVWDQLAQFIAIRTMEWFDWLPIFGKSIAANFLAPSRLDDRFFTLLVFLHIAIPLFLLLFLWLHLNRITRPRINPPRGLAIGAFATMLVLSLAYPATSHAPANLATVPTVLSLDWYYLAAYPLMEVLSYGTVWGAAVTLTLIMAALPWMPAMRRLPAARVDLDNCNGCTRCEDDCPYAAITMVPRTDGSPFQREPQVSDARCVSCGICAGACPTGTPFRQGANLAPGIDLPHLPLRELRDRLIEIGERPAGTRRVVLFTCDHTVGEGRLDNEAAAVVSLPCVGMLPPAFIDYVLSRDIADGVMVAGCRDGDCYARLGLRWAEDRLARRRDPGLRRRVPRERVAFIRLSAVETDRLRGAIASFTEHLAALPTAGRAELPTLGEAGREAELDYEPVRYD